MTSHTGGSVSLCKLFSCKKKACASPDQKQREQSAKVVSTGTAVMQQLAAMMEERYFQGMLLYACTVGSCMYSSPDLLKTQGHIWRNHTQEGKEAVRRNRLLRCGSACNGENVDCTAASHVSHYERKTDAPPEVREQINRGVVTCEKGSALWEARLRLLPDRKQREVKDRKQLYACTQCDYLGVKKYHADCHFLRIHINGGNPIIGKRKYNADGEESGGSGSAADEPVPKKKKKVYGRHFTYRCATCSYVTDRPLSLHKHVRNKHGGDDPQWRPAECNSSSSGGSRKGGMAVTESWRAGILSAQAESSDGLAAEQGEASEKAVEADRRRARSHAAFQMPSPEKCVYFGDWMDGCKAWNQHISATVAAKHKSLDEERLQRLMEVGVEVAEAARVEEEEDDDQGQEHRQQQEQHGSGVQGGSSACVFFGDDEFEFGNAFSDNESSSGAWMSEW